MTQQDALIYAECDVFEFTLGATQNDQDIALPRGWFLLPLIVLGFCAWWYILSALFF